MQKYEITSKEYRSNCMIEALKAKIRNPKIKIYFCKPRITENGHFQMFHFMWSDGYADYDFSDLEENGLPPYRNLLFKGVIRKFELGFAEKYSRYRNKRRVIKMPVHKARGGYKFGKSGKTYRGKGAKKKAQKQARAIYASGYREGKKKLNYMLLQQIHTQKNYENHGLEHLERIADKDLIVLCKDCHKKFHDKVIN